MEGNKFLQQPLPGNNYQPRSLLLPNIPQPAAPSHSRSASQPSSFFPSCSASFVFNASPVSKKEPTTHNNSCPPLAVDVLMSDLDVSTPSSHTGIGTLVPPFSSLPPLSPSMNPSSKRNISDLKQVMVNSSDLKQQPPMSPAPLRKGHRRAHSEIPSKITSGAGLESLFDRSASQNITIVKEKGMEASKLMSCVMHNDLGQRKVKRELLGESGTEQGPTAEELLSMYLGMEMDDGLEEDGDGIDSAEECEREERERVDVYGNSTMKNYIKEAETSAASKVGFLHHSRSASMDSMTSSNKLVDEAPQGFSAQPRKVCHAHNHSMDGSVSSRMEFGFGEFDEVEMKKILATDKLQELVVVDPKKVKRILANRQSAARSKERKTRYITELERKVHTLQSEATSLSAQLTLLQRDSTGLSSENSALKLRLQAIEQQVHLHEALNEALQEEVQRLKITAVYMGGHALPSQLPYPMSHQGQTKVQEQGMVNSSLIPSSHQNSRLEFFESTSGSALDLMTST